PSSSTDRSRPNSWASTRSLLPVRRTSSVSPCKAPKGGAATGSTPSAMTRSSSSSRHPSSPRRSMEPQHAATSPSGSTSAVGPRREHQGNDALPRLERRATGEVPCPEPHPLEVFVQTQFPNPAGDPYPGDAALQAFAVNQCTGGAFADYVGRDFDSSSLDAHSLYPDDQGWKANNRELLCILSPTNGEPTTGSARASGR